MLVNLTQCKSRGLCLLSANCILSAYKNAPIFFYIRKYFCLELKCRDLWQCCKREACKAKKQSPNGETWLRVSEVQGGSQNMVTIGAKIAGMLNNLKCKSKLIWRKTWKKNKIRLASWQTQWSPGGSKLFPFTDETAVLIGTFHGSQPWYTLVSEVYNSLDLEALFVLWHALSTVGSFIDGFVPFQIMSNQLHHRWGPIKL